MTTASPGRFGATRRGLAIVTTTVALALTGCATAPDPSEATPTLMPLTVEPGPVDAATAAALAQRPAVHGYSFPAGMVPTPGQPSFTPLNGVLSVPTTPGPHPVAIIVHGSYPACVDITRAKLVTREANTTPWVEVCPAERTAYGHELTLGPDYFRASASFGYLAQELATRGIAAIAVDVNAKERLTWSRDAAPFELQNAIVRAHLDVLARLNSGDALGLPWGGDVKGRLDLSSLAVLGHSTGGGYAVEVAAQRPFPGLKAVVAIQPGQSHIEASIADLVPTLLITAKCDEQVAEMGLKSAAALAKAAPRGVVLSESAPHTTHIGVLSGGGSHEVGPVSPVQGRECAGPALLAPQQMAASTALVAADFVEATFKGTTAYRLGRGAGEEPTATSWTSAASVSLVEKPLPPVLRARDIAFAESSVAILPPATPDIQLGDAADDFEAGYKKSQSQSPSPSP